jgi:AcrR family transcriptional regulator
VSTNTIAGHLDISPGNLYYHFANKEQIVRELWSWVEANGAELQSAVERSSQDGDSSTTGEQSETSRFLPAEGLGEYFLATIDGMWRFRFFFRDMDELIARDPEVARTFRAHMEWGRQRITAMFQSLIDHGDMSAPPDDKGLERLAVNLQLLLLNWIRYVAVVRGTPTVTEGDLAEGGLQAFFLVEPYLEHDYATRARAALEGQPDDKAQARPLGSARSRRSYRRTASS